MKKIKIQQYGSPIRCPQKQRLHLKSLGLGKMNKVRVLVDSDSVRGLLKKVPHLVRILEENIHEA